MPPGGQPGRGEGMFSRRFAASIAIAGAVTALAACGEQQRRRQGREGGLGAGVSPKGATAIKPGKAGGKLTVLALGRRRLPRPGPDVLHVRLHGPLRGQPDRCTRSSPTTPRSPCRTSPTATPRDLRRTTRRSRSRSSPASSTPRRSTARSRPPRTSSTRSSAPSPRTCRSGYAASYFSSTSSARPRSPTTATSSRSRASRRPTTRRSSSSSRPRARRASPRRS